VAIRSSEYFIFNGQKSEDFGIVNVNVNSGMQSEPFVAGRTIKEQVIRGRDRPYYFGIQLQPLEFTVSFAFTQPWDSDLIKSVARWLTTPNYYVPMQFSDNLDIYYYCLCVDSPELIHNCLAEGYINLKFRCDGAYAYSPIYTTNVFDYSNNPSGGTQYKFENYGDVECQPIIYIQKIGTGDDIKIINTSNSGQTLILTGLQDQENIVVDCELNTIETDIPLTYRYSNHNGVFLSMVRGFNYLTIQGKCKLQWKYQFRILTQG
jgi:phage-related protein